MYRSLIISTCSLLIVLLFTASPAAASTLPNGVTLPGGDAALVLNAADGQVIYAENGETMLAPASTTKVLTALVVLDVNKNMERLTTVSPRAAAVEEATLYLRIGEQMSLSDLLTGALLHSGNDACHALAEATAGSVQLFVHWMELKCALLGVYNVQLANCHGLPDEAHLISAHGLALVARAACKHEFFRSTVAKKSAEIGSGTSYRYYKNTNKLLWQDNHIVGIKTGTTNQAGHCLIAAWQSEDALYISVVLASHDRWGASLALLRYAAAGS